VNIRRFLEDRDENSMKPATFTCTSLPTVTTGTFTDELQKCCIIDHMNGYSPMISENAYHDVISARF